jgi:hypothetical protein
MCILLAVLAIWHIMQHIKAEVDLLELLPVLDLMLRV